MLVKFWLHISRRGAARSASRRAQTDPLKAWKLTDEDWRNREKRRRVRARRSRRCSSGPSTEFAPWTLVEADSKRYARVKVIETVIAAAEDGLRAPRRCEPPGRL